MQEQERLQNTSNRTSKSIESEIIKAEKEIRQPFNFDFKNQSIGKRYTIGKHVKKAL